MNLIVVPRKLLAFRAPNQLVGTKVIIIRNGSFTEVFFSLGFVLWLRVLYLCIVFWDKLCRLLVANTENVEQLKLSIMHTNNEERYLVSIYLCHVFL